MSIPYAILLIVCALTLWFAIDFAITIGLVWAIDSIWHVHASFWAVSVLVFIVPALLRSSVSVSKS